MREEVLEILEHEIPPLDGHRGVMTGMIGLALFEKAASLGIPFQYKTTLQRRMRLDVASHVYDREIRSYNELKYHELWALFQWVVRGARGAEDWLRQKYGEQLTLL